MVIQQDMGRGIRKQGKSEKYKRNEKCLPSKPVPEIYTGSTDTAVPFDFRLSTAFTLLVDWQVLKNISQAGGYTCKGPFNCVYTL